MSGGALGAVRSICKFGVAARHARFPRRRCGSHHVIGHYWITWVACTMID